MRASALLPIARAPVAGPAAQRELPFLSTAARSAATPPEGQTGQRQAEEGERCGFGRVVDRRVEEKGVVREPVDVAGILVGRATVAAGQVVDLVVRPDRGLSLHEKPVLGSPNKDECCGRRKLHTGKDRRSRK